MSRHDCQEWHVELWHALDGELQPEKAEGLVTHLRSCAGCRESMQDSVALHRRLLESSVRANLREVVNTSYTLPENPEIERRQRARRTIVIDRSVIFAAASILVVASIFSYNYFFPHSLDLTVLASTATVESVSGNVSVIDEYTDQKLAIHAEQRLYGKSGVEVSGPANAVIRFPDGSRIELSAAAGRLTRFWLHYAPNRKINKTPGQGKHFTLEAGTLTATFAKQAADTPAIIGTSQAEALVVGTKFTLTSAMGITRLEVEEGKVQFTRISDFASVAVDAGQFAVAGNPGEFKAERKGN